jgi:hypothetical protein
MDRTIDGNLQKSLTGNKSLKNLWTRETGRSG